jgi:hypothetical protein
VAFAALRGWNTIPPDWLSRFDHGEPLILAPLPDIGFTLVERASA